MTRTDGTVLAALCSAACLAELSLLERTGEKFADIRDIGAR